MKDKSSPQGIVASALLDVFKAAMRAPGTKDALNKKIKSSSPRLREKLANILKDDEKSETMKGFSYNDEEDFSDGLHPFFIKRIVPVTGFEVIMVIGGLLVGILSIPNIGDRIANMLRERFHISREAQFAIARLIGSAGKIGSFILGTLITINKVLTMNNFLQMAADKNYNEKSFSDSLVSLYKNPITRSAVVKSAYKLDDHGRDVIRGVLARGGQTVNFSELDLEFSSLNNLRQRMRPQLEVQKPKPLDIVMTIARVIASMLAVPGMGFIIAGILNSFISMNQLDLIIAGAVFSLLGQFGKQFIDDIQKIKGAMIGTEPI